MVSATPKVPPNWRTAWSGGAADAACGSWVALGRRRWRAAGRRGRRRGRSAPWTGSSPQVVDLGAEHEQPVQTAARVEDAADEEDRSLPDRAGEPAGPWARRGATIAGPGATPKPAWRIDQSHTWVRNRIDPKKRAENAVPNDEHGEVPPREVGDAEQVEVQRGSLGSTLVGDEDEQQRTSAGGRGAERASAEPPTSSEPMTAVGQQRRRTGDERDTEERRDLGLGVGRLVQVPPPGEHRVHADREVDEERPAPTEALDDGGAQCGSERTGDRAGDAPDRDRPRSWSWANACMTSASDDGIARQRLRPGGSGTRSGPRRTAPARTPWRPP